MDRGSLSVVARDTVYRELYIVVEHSRKVAVTLAHAKERTDCAVKIRSHLDESIAFLHWT
jgi:hypothetical protein